MAYTHVGGDSEATIGGSALQKMSSCLTTLDLFLCQPHAILSACVLANANRGKSGSAAASLRDVVGHILGELNLSQASTVPITAVVFNVASKYFRVYSVLNLLSKPLQ